MSAESKIEWTDATWNPTVVATRYHLAVPTATPKPSPNASGASQGHPYEQGFDLRLVPEKLAEPLTWASPRRSS